MGKSTYKNPDEPKFNYSDLFGQVIFVYKNYKGIIEERRVTPIEFVFKTSHYHDEAQWFLVGYCHTRLAVRDFAVEDIISSIRHVRRRNNDAKRVVLAHAEKRRAQEHAAIGTNTTGMVRIEDGNVDRVPPTKSVQRLTNDTEDATIIE